MHMNKFEQNVVRTWGENGQAWLNALPKVVKHLSDLWHLRKLEPVNDLSYNYVLKGYKHTVPVILKLSCNSEDLKYEMLALEAYNGESSIRLLDTHADFNALLLEQAIPGTTLVPFFPERDREALEYTVTIMQQLHKVPLPEGLPSLEVWFKSLFNTTLTIYHIDKAREIVRHLLATQERSVLLHGDLHHANILLSSRGWLAIDPKGIIGDPAYEPYSFLKNPQREVLKQKKLILNRLSLFSEQLAIKKERLYAWLYAQLVLDICWAAEEGEDPKQAVANADLIDSLSIDCEL